MEDTYFGHFQEYDDCPPQYCTRVTCYCKKNNCEKMEWSCGDITDCSICFTQSKPQTSRRLMPCVCCICCPTALQWLDKCVGEVPAAVMPACSVWHRISDVTWCIDSTCKGGRKEMRESSIDHEGHKQERCEERPRQVFSPVTILFWLSFFVTFYFLSHTLLKLFQQL